MIKIAKGVRYIETLLIALCGTLLMAMMLLGTGDVLGRYLLNKPIVGTLEINTMMMGAIVLLGWAYTQRERKHVKVVLFLNMFPPRVQTILNFSTLFISLLLFIVITQQSWNIAVENLLEGRQFQILDFPKGPFYFLVPAGAFFICLEFIIQIFEFISRKNKEVD